MFFSRSYFHRACKSVPVLLGISLLSGCAFFKRDSYSVPTVLLPQRYLKAQSIQVNLNAPEEIRQESQVTQSVSLMLGEWWLLLRSAELNALIDRVLVNNRDLRIATLRMAQMQARMDVAGAGRFPEVNLAVLAKGEVPSFRGSSGSGKPDVLHSYQPSVRVDWRPDLWGEFAAQFEASQLNLWRSTFLRDDLQRTTVSSAIAAYLEYLSLNDRLRVAQATDRVVSELLATVAARLEIGDATAIDYEQQKAAVYQVRATIPVLQQQRELVFNRLSALAGAMPSNFQLSDKGLDSVSFPAVLPGVPSALLLRRPDVRAVEAQLLAADADIDLARARILPPLDLTSQIGYGSYQLSNLFQPYNLAWNFIANLSANLFDSGKRAKEVEFSRVVHEEMVETYLRVIYEGAREVDTSLSAVKMMESRMELQRVSADAARKAWFYSQEAYNAGVVDYQVVLDSERTYTRNLDEWINARLQRYQGLTSLFSALGGGVAPGVALPGGGVRPKELKSTMADGGLLIAPVAADVLAKTTTTTSTSTSPSTSTSTSTSVAGKASNFVADKPQIKIEFPPAGQAESGDSMVSLLPPSKLGVRLQGVDWNQGIWHEPANHWLVELIGPFQRSAVALAWLDLQKRLPKQIDGKRLLPRRQDIATADNKSAIWYRLYLGANPNKETASQLCADLLSIQQRCRVVQVKQSGDAQIEPVFVELSPDFRQPVTGKPETLFQGIDWPEDIWREKGEHWLVEITGMYERTAIAPAWRDLQERFATQVKDRILVPHRQGVVMNETKERASWYRLYVARSPNAAAALQLCADLQDKQQRCRVVMAKPSGNQNDLHPEPIFIEVNQDMTQRVANKSVAN